MCGLWGYLLKAKALAPINARRVPEGGWYLNVPSEVNCTCSIDEQVLYGRKSNRRVQEKRAIIPTSMKRFPNTKSLKNSLLRRICWQRVQTLRVSSINNTLWKGSAQHDDLKGKLEHPIRDCSSAEQTGSRPLKAHFQPWCIARISCYGEIVDSYERLISTKIQYPLEKLRLSVWKKMSSVRATLAIRLKKEVSSVWTARGICWKQIVILSNGSGFPFKKIVIRSMDSSTSMRNNTYLLTLQANCGKEKRNADATTADYLSQVFRD